MADRERMREMGRKGAAVRWANARAARELIPFAGTIVDAMDAAGLVGESWAAWRAFWRAVFALPMSDAELAVYRRHTGREDAPAAPVKEAWQVIGRRGGKSRNAAVAAAYLAIRADYTKVLAPGERGVIPVIAADRQQARQVLGYLKGVTHLPRFAPYVARRLRDTVEFRTGVSVEVHTASYRTTRGYTVVGLVADEVAFWRSDESVSPDTEVLNALKPGMATVPGALLLGLSTPYARRGELHRAHDRYYGQPDARVLVWNADTRSMNPMIDAQVIADAFEEDPLAAASEYGQDGRVAFRHDVESFLTPEAVEAVVATGRPLELPYREVVRYVAFTDPSGGSSDAWTLALAHSEKRGETAVAVVDVVRERRPPFSPDAVVQEYAALLKSYHVTTVTGDHYAGEFPRELFRKQGIEYRLAEQTKSDFYREVLAPVNAGRVELPDHKGLKVQLLGLERRVARSGKDSIDHQPGARDDVANAVAGAVVTALSQQQEIVVRPVGTTRQSPWTAHARERSATWAPWMDSTEPRPR